MKKLFKLSIITLFLSLIVSGCSISSKNIGGGNGTIGQLDVFKVVSGIITPRNAANNLQIPALSSAGLCVITNASGTLSTTSCGAGGGIALTDLSSVSPVLYNNLTGVFSLNTDLSIYNNATSSFITSSALNPYLATTTAASLYTPLTRNLTINGTSYDLSADRSWTIAASGATTTINGVNGPNFSFLTGTTGTDFGIATTTGTVTFNLPTASASNRGLLSTTDWSTFNNKVSSQWTTSGNNIYNSNTGNVGIGTTTPGAKLHISGTAGTGLLIERTDSTYNSSAQFKNTVGSTYIGQYTTDFRIGTNPDLNISNLVTVQSGGNVGVGTTSPTAYLHIKAGTSATGTAPIKLTSGTNLATPETGAMEYDGTDLYFTPSGTTRQTIAYLSDLGGSATTTINSVAGPIFTFAAGTSGSDFNIATSTGTITFNIPTASASNRGLLSTTDWSTFNNKQNALTNPITGTGTANEISYWTATGTQGTLAVATYPSLTELSYVKGVTGAIQTQINGKQATLVSGTSIKTINGSSILASGDLPLMASSTALNSINALNWTTGTPFVKMTAANTFALDTNTYLTSLSGAELLSNKATDFTTINNTLYPTVQAVNNAITTAVTGLLDYRGSYDASTNLYPATGGSGIAGAILKGDFWICSVAGTLGGTAVSAGDLIIAIVDTPVQTSTNWDLISHDYGYTPVPTTRSLTINGTAYDLSADRSWTVSPAETTSTIGTLINDSTATTTPAEADKFSIWGSVTSALQHITWTNLKTAIKTYYDSVVSTLTNKRITPRIGSIATTTSLTIDSDSYDQYNITALAADLTINAPSGTPTIGQKLILRITPDATPRALTWATSTGGFATSSDLALPSTTVASKTMYLGFIWNSLTSRWNLLAFINNF